MNTTAPPGHVETGHRRLAGLLAAVIAATAAVACTATEADIGDTHEPVPCGYWCFDAEPGSHPRVASPRSS